jgi:hypothetical protein
MRFVLGGGANFDQVGQVGVARRTFKGEFGRDGERLWGDALRSVRLERRNRLEQVENPLPDYFQ